MTRIERIPVFTPIGTNKLNTNKHKYTSPITTNIYTDHGFYGYNGLKALRNGWQGIAMPYKMTR